MLRDFEELIKDIEELPMTWIPGVLSAVIRRAKKENVFVADGGLQRFIEQTLNRMDTRQGKTTSIKRDAKEV